MFRFQTFVGLLALISITVAQIDDPFLNDTFPEGFHFGMATASYQIEGGWDADGKGENIWDNFTHRIPSPIFDGSDGDVACDSYNKYAEDVALLKNMGVDFYRFSLSWSRLLPTGRVDQVNQPGVDYYNKLIDLLIENGIEPVVTLYHWDLPQAFMEYGGWPNETMVEYYTEYADFAFKTFGDRVKKWITFNEPWVVCIQGYSNGDMAPGIISVTQPYQCAHTIIKSHAKAYRHYNLNYRAEQGGLIGITLDSGWHEPKNASNPDDVAAAERALQFKQGWFCAPLTFGHYPDLMREYVDRHSENDGVPSRLPQFTLAEAIEIRGTYDFLGLNHYTTNLAETQVSTGSGWNADQDVQSSVDPSWPGSSASWLKVVPWGFRKLLNWLKNTYGSPEIYVTESGYADYPTTGIQDDDRVNYYTQYINQLLKAVVVDKVRVTAYTAWSLMDNFEWARGYSERFGTHFVDFTDPSRPRTQKASALALKQIFADKGFPPTKK